MKIRSRNNIKIQTNTLFEHNNLNPQCITYNKPLFINMTNETNNNYKTSTLSTKINTSNLESPFNGSYKKNKINCNISVGEFNLGKDCSKTRVNFFKNEINTSLSSNEDGNNIKKNETFTPDKNSLFLKDEEEQFTPYLGQKNNENSICNKNKNCLSDIDINNKENKNFSNIFNNSKEIITRSSLNLKNHLDERLSNNSKTINKYQKLSFYQKNINRGSKTNNYFMNKNIYNKKSFLLKKNVNNIKENNKDKLIKKVIIIQAIFRGYIYRIKLYNKLKKFTYVTLFCKTVNNILLKRKMFIFKGWIYLKERQDKIRKNVQNMLMKSNRISFYIKGNSSKIKNLIDKNNNLRLKLSEFLINNTKLKIDIDNYREIEEKYNILLIQFEKMQNINYNLIEEKNKLLNEINSLKYENIKKAKSNCISHQNSLYLISNYNNGKNVNKYQNFVICKGINSFSILNKDGINSFRNSALTEENVKSMNLFNNINDSEINHNLEYSDLRKNKDKFDNKNYKLIIVKKINFIIKKVPKRENEFNEIK